MGYTYEDFEKKATDAGMMGQFSQYDLDTARQYPEFGLSILGLKQDYASATTPEQKLLINEAANQIRNSFGSYSGGGDGSKYLYNGTKTDSLLGKVTGYAPYTSRNDGASQGILDQIGSFGSFSYDKAAPTYNNAYVQQQQKLLDSIVNRPDFSWSKEEDPQWGSIKKSYLREGERATADALGQASAASGGRPSSYAVNAATQAGDYYATKLNDMIPTLYQQAYERYLKEFQMQQQALDAVNQQEQLDYNKYLTELGQYNTDRNFDYQAYLDDFSRLQSQLGAYQSAEQMDRDLYQMGLDNLISQYSAAAGREDTLYGRTWQEQALALEQAAQQKSFYQQQLDAMLAAGASPSAEMIAGSGYTNEYVQAMENYHKQQQLAEAVSGSGGGSSGSARSSGSSYGGTGMDYDGLFAAAKESGNPKSFIANNYKRYGFTSSTGLYDDYKNQQESQAAANSIDMNSIINLGFGPLSAQGLDQLVRSGQVEEYEENGKTRFRLAGTGKSGASVRVGW
ncbi:MAG: hypothetical protein HDT20_04245 [Oscillibacter sp.]|nr:hypothetical protein [Oscillibacter sp.]